MTYSKDLRQSVHDKIDEYTKEYLDNYTRDTLKAEADKAMDANEAPSKVADAVYKYAYDNNSAVMPISVAIGQCAPNGILLVLWHELISMLNKG